MIRTAALSLLICTPAWADGLTQTEAAATTICMADGPVDARIEALQDVGWVPVADADLPTAAAPLRAGQIVGIQSSNSSYALTDLLRVVADPQTTQPMSGIDYFADGPLPDASILRLTAFGGIVICEIGLSQTVTPDKVAQAIGLRVSRTDTMSAGAVAFIGNDQNPFAVSMLLPDPVAFAEAGADSGLALLVIQSAGE